MDMKLPAFLALAGCVANAGAASSPHAATGVDALSLVGEGNESIGVRRLTANAKLTVFVFFSPDCHCVSAHETRLRALDERYRPRGAQFFWIDAEAGGSREADSAEARKRGYSFPILLDRDAKLADRLGAEYSSYAVIVDSSGVIRYRGGIDSDKDHLRADATPYLKNAIDDLLARREVGVAETQALGCALRRK